MFNPRMTMHEVPIFGPHRAYVFDDALAEPLRWIELAAMHAGSFEEAPFNAFPGPELRMPDALADRLGDLFAHHVRARLGASRTVRQYCRLSIATKTPDQLAPRQWLCHRDRIATDHDEISAACVAYLFDDPSLGGTAFYRARRPREEIDRLVHASGSMDRDAFRLQSGLQPGYMSASNIWFEKVATVEPRFNRLVFYDGGLFHCSDITAPERLDPDPRRGRLTLNGFFACRRQAD